MGTFHTHKNALGTDNEFKIILYGDLGTVEVCVERPREVRVCLRNDRLQAAHVETVQVGETYSRRLLEDFVSYIDHPQSVAVPTLLDGYRNQMVMQMVIDSAETGRTQTMAWNN